MDKQINLAWMYPDILNLHGERGNVQAFKYVADLLGVTLNIERIDDVDAKIDFSHFDILLFNAGELKVLPTILKSLNEQKEELQEYIEQKKTIIVTGTTSALLGNKIHLLCGQSFEGLHIFDADYQERKMVIGDDLYYTLEDGLEVVGSQIQMVDITLGEDDKPLGTIQYGYGNNGTSIEGAKKNHILFTNCLGPVFVKNPWFAEKILRTVCEQKEIEIATDLEINYELEKNSLTATKEFIEKKLLK